MTCCATIEIVRSGLLVSQQVARLAIATRAAVVALGGDGTLNTVAQAAHAVGCAMGVVPQGKAGAPIPQAARVTVLRCAPRR